MWYLLILFVKRIIKCKGKHVFIDGGRYRVSLGSTSGFHYTVIHFGPRSAKVLLSSRLAYQEVLGDISRQGYH